MQAQALRVGKALGRLAVWASGALAAWRRGRRPWRGAMRRQASSRCPFVFRVSLYSQQKLRPRCTAFIHSQT